MNQNEERELSWDDPIEKDGGDYKVAPSGDYDFEIVDLQRGRHTPKTGGKLPACNKAVLKVRVQTADGEVIDIRHNLYLHSRCEGMLCAFFTSIGRRKHGEKLCPVWDRVIGSRGRCKVKIYKWKTKDGDEVEDNDIQKFYEPKGGQVQQPAQQQQPPDGNDDVPF